MNWCCTKRPWLGLLLLTLCPGYSIPALEVQKTVYLGHNNGLSCPGTLSLTAAPDREITFCFSVSNDLPSAVTNLLLRDPSFTSFLPVAVGTLPPGSMTSYYYQSATKLPLTNVAGVTAYEVDTGQPVSGSGTGVVNIFYPELVISKTVYLGHDGGASCPGKKNIEGPLGTNVTYCFEVLNAGDTVVSNIVVTDADLGMPAQQVGTLLPSGTYVGHFDDVLSGDLINTAGVSGHDPNGQEVAGSDAASVTVASGNPGFCQFTITDLGDLGGGQSGAWALNDYGQVVGWSFNSVSNYRAFLWTTNGGMQDLGTFGGPSAQAFDINNLGHVSGIAAVNASNNAGFFMVNGVKTNIGWLGGMHSLGFSLNEQDQLVGNATVIGMVTNRAVIWTNGVLKSLGTISPGTSEAHGINNNGRVVGFLDVSPPENELMFFQPYIWWDRNGDGLGQPTNEFVVLGTLGGNNGIAYDINDQGVVVGGADSNATRRAIFYVQPDGTNYWRDVDSNGVNDLMVSLKTLGGTLAEAHAINESGTIVGWSRIPIGQYNAFIYRDGVLTNLNSLLPSTSTWTLVDATDVNEAGQICGRGKIAGKDRAFLMTPCEVKVNITSMYNLPTDGSNLFTFIRWVGVGQPMEYTLEKADRIDSTNWIAVPPTGTWPSAEAFWTGTVTQDLQHFLFRVRGNVLTPDP